MPNTFFRKNWIEFIMICFWRGWRKDSLIPSLKDGMTLKTVKWIKEWHGRLNVLPTILSLKTISFWQSFSLQKRLKNLLKMTLCISSSMMLQHLEAWRTVSPGKKKLCLVQAILQAKQSQLMRTESNKILAWSSIKKSQKVQEQLLVPIT